MIHFSKKALLFSGLISLVCISVAQAGSVQASLDSLANGAVKPYTSNLTTRFMDNTGNWEVYNNTLAGKINWTNVKVPGNLGVSWIPSDPGYGYFQTGQNFYTFCIEGTQNVWVPGTAQWTSVALGSAPQGSNIATALASGMGAAKAGWLTEFWNQNIGAVLDTNQTTAQANAHAAGFQLGVWGIVYNATSLNYFQSGNQDKFDSVVATNYFRIDKAPANDPAINAANAMLTNVTGGNYGQNYTLVGLSNGFFQDQVVGFPVTAGPNEIPAVPLPAAFPAGLAMLGGLAALRGWKRRSRLD